MKIKLNELRTLIRKIAAMQIAEAATKRKPVAKDAKKISVNEIRSMIKEALLKEIELTPEILRNRREAAERLVNQLGNNWVRAAELLKIEGSQEERKQSLIDKMAYYLGNPNDRIDGKTPKEFINFIKTEKGLRKGIERMSQDKDLSDAPTPIYQTGEEKLQAIATDLDVSKQMAAKIVDGAMKKLAQTIALTAGNKFKGKSSEEISNILKTVRKGDYSLMLKKSFEEAISKTHEMLEDLVLDAAEKFIDEINEKIDFPFENYDNLNEEEQKEVNEKIFAFLNSIDVQDATDEEFSLIVDMLDYNNLEDNKKLLANLFFEAGNKNAIFPRIANAFTKEYRPQIEKQFNPETRGRGSVDEKIVEAIKDILLSSAD